MKTGAAGDSLLMSALHACRARLKAFIRGRSAVREDADDIFQEMTDRARKKREVPLPGYFSADDDGDFAEDEIAETLFGIPQTPEEEYLKTLMWEELENALSELPSPQREVFEKTELQGYSMKTLAEENGVSVQTLLSRKHKAVLYLRTRLRDIYDALTGE